MRFFHLLFIDGGRTQCYLAKAKVRSRRHVDASYDATALLHALGNLSICGRCGLQNEPGNTSPTSPDDRTQRLALLGLTPTDVRAPSLVVHAGQTFEFSDDNPSAKAWLHPLPEPTDFADLKQMVGVPNEVFERNNTTHERVYSGLGAESLEEVGLQALGDQQSSTHRMATNLVYSYADDATLNAPAVQSLIPVMLSAVRGLNAVVGQDLVVDNGAVVDLGPNPVVQFDKITIYGTGRIVVHNNQKVQATSIQWIPNAQLGGGA
jgi:hypothetical protein